MVFLLKNNLVLLFFSRCEFYKKHSFFKNRVSRELCIFCSLFSLQENTVNYSKLFTGEKSTINSNKIWTVEHLTNKLFVRLPFVNSLTSCEKLKKNFNCYKTFLKHFHHWNFASHPVCFRIFTFPAIAMYGDIPDMALIGKCMDW